MEELEKKLYKDIEYCTILCENCAKHKKRVYSSRKTPYYIFCEGNRFSKPNNILGFLLFQPKLLPLITKKIFITVDKPTCYSRRMDTFPVPEEYFQKLIWPYYLKQNSHVSQLQDVLLLDGTIPSEEQLVLALNFVMNCEYHDKQETYRSNLNSIFLPS
jgi:hypothetical protein